MESKPASLLKYRFGSLDLLQHHLHVVEGRTLFFLRDPHIAILGGARVVIEFSFGNSEQAINLRGSVLARFDGLGGLSGVWIEFPDAKLARKLDQGAPAIAGRGQRRLACDMLVELKVHDRQHLGRMIDVSLHGVRIVTAARMESGAEVEVRIMGAEPPLPGLLGRGQVVRADPGGDLGVKYVRSDVVARVASSKLYSAVQEAWQKAPEVVHSPLCCSGGPVQEPPLPHMKNRA